MISVYVVLMIRFYSCVYIKIYQQHWSHCSFVWVFPSSSFYHDRTVYVIWKDAAIALWWYNNEHTACRAARVNKHKSYIVSVKRHCKYSDSSIEIAKRWFIILKHWLNDAFGFTNESKKNILSNPKNLISCVPSNCQNIYIFVSHYWLHGKFSATFNRYCVICVCVCKVRIFLWDSNGSIINPYICV